MINLIFRYAENSRHHWLLEFMMHCRAMWFVGRTHVCPCCNWSLSRFTEGGTSLKSRPNGYCPRCNSKARHRRDWLFLQEHTNLFREPVRLLHVGPKYALSRRLVKQSNIDYVGVDCQPRPNVTHRVDITSIPFDSNSFDAVICLHVLEHVADDRSAMNEMYRVLKPGGWALISVPLRMDQPTYEDSSVVDPADRKRAFGEEQHVRVYGMDIVQRLECAGFQVTLHRAEELDPKDCRRYGLLTNEHPLLCTKA